MKKICAMAALLMGASLIAKGQLSSNADKYVLEGNAYAQKQQYQQALDSYRQVLSLWGDSVSDGSVVFIAAYCAKETNELLLSLDLFAQSRDLGYKPDEAQYHICAIRQQQEDREEYEAELRFGYENFKSGRFFSLFRKELVNVYRDKAFAQYKKGKNLLDDGNKNDAQSILIEAKQLIEKALEIDSQDKYALRIKSMIEQIL